MENGTATEMYIFCEQSSPFRPRPGSSIPPYCLIYGASSSSALPELIPEREYFLPLCVYWVLTFAVPCGIVRLELDSVSGVGNCSPFLANGCSTLFCHRFWNNAPSFLTAYSISPFVLLPYAAAHRRIRFTKKQQKSLCSSAAFGIGFASQPSAGSPRTVRMISAAISTPVQAVIPAIWALELTSQSSGRPFSSCKRSTPPNVSPSS